MVCASGEARILPLIWAQQMSNHPLIVRPNIQFNVRIGVGESTFILFKA